MQFKSPQLFAKITTSAPLLCCSIFITASSCFSAVLDRLTYRWSDLNTREVAEWVGDTAHIRQGSTTTELTCKITVEPSEVAFAINSFGIPSQWTSISYKDEADLAKKQQQLRERASTHGIKMLQEGNKFIVDYKWVVDHSTKDLVDVARTIRNTARRKGYRSRRELIGAIASFAQSMEYRIPPDHRTNEEGEKILTAGAMMPLETLTNRWGDCDSKSLLFASLARSIDLVDVCFIVMDKHLFAGIHITPEQDDDKIRYKGKEWVLVELSEAWPLGRIPRDHVNAIIQGHYEVVALD